MKICLVSTFLAQCGIATYTESLGTALQGINPENEIVVLAEAEPNQPNRGTSPCKYFRIWNRGTFIGELFANAIIESKVKVDVVHFQHEYGLFPNSFEFLTACKLLRKAGLKVFVTLHTVHAPPNKAAFLFELGNVANKVIVHTPTAGAAIRFRPYTPIEIIPHGVHLRTSDKPGNSNFVCPGFMSESKGHMEIIEGFANYVSSLNGVACPTLTIIGLCRDFVYFQKLEQKINHFGLERHVRLINKYISDDELVNEVLTHSVVILGSGKTSPYSASGQLALALGCNRPIIAKNVPIYNNTPVMLYNDSTELGMLLHGWGPWTSELAAIAQERAWPKVAQKHLALYENL